MPESAQDAIDEAGRSAGGGSSGPSLRPLTAVVPLLVATTVVTSVLAFLQKRPCQRAKFDFRETVSNACYTDVYPLFFNRGLADGKVPYFDTIEEPVEYPVLTGWFMHGVASLSRWVTGSDDVAMTFYDLTAMAMAGFALVAVLVVAYAAGRHNLRAGLLVSLSPGLLLAAYINWDLLAVALTAAAVAVWARRWRTSNGARYGPLIAGVLLGLAVSAKFYPVVFLGAFGVLCLRAGKLREFGLLFAGTAGTWLVINVPVMLLAWDGWTRFYTFNQERPVDWGSIFFWFSNRQTPVLGDAESLNKLGTGLFLILCLGIAVLALKAPVRPRLPQIMLLVLAAFMLTNKVWSPQYVLWLLPVMALARPKIPAFVVWQIGEVIYFFGIWFYLLAIGIVADMGEGLPSYPIRFLGRDLSLSAAEIDNWYYFALFARFLTVLMMALLVVAEILRPGRDFVRADGDDDPAGGVLDGAQDRPPHWLGFLAPAGAGKAAVS